MAGCSRPEVGRLLLGGPLGKDSPIQRNRGRRRSTLTLMGTRFQRRIKLGKHTWINLSKSGPSISTKIGPTTFNSRGTTSTHIAPGLSYRTKAPRRGTVAVPAQKQAAPVVLSAPGAHAVAMWIGLSVVSCALPIVLAFVMWPLAPLALVGTFLCTTHAVKVRQLSQAWPHRSDAPDAFLASSHRPVTLTQGIITNGSDSVAASETVITAKIEQGGTCRLSFTAGKNRVRASVPPEAADDIQGFLDACIDAGADVKPPTE